MTTIESKHSTRLHRIVDAFALVTLGVIAVAISLRRGLSLDHTVAQHIQQLGDTRPWLPGFMLTITHMGDTITMITATLVFALLLHRITGSRRASYSMILAYLIAWLGNNLIKIVFDRERPQLSPLYIDPSSYSFPSGHAMISAAVYGTAAALFSETFPRFKWPIRLAATLLVLIIGTSRVYLDAHWPSDVVAGFAAGWITISIVRIIFPAQGEEKPRNIRKEDGKIRKKN
jgi:membrane-associated phospholipid phosphatase